MPAKKKLRNDPLKPFAPNNADGQYHPYALAKDLQPNADGGQEAARTKGSAGGLTVSPPPMNWKRYKDA